MLKNETADKLANSLFPYFLIIVIGLICYLGTFHIPFIFDDFPSIVDNRSIKNIGDFGAIWHFHAPRFVVYLTFALNYYFHGLKPFGYHLVNLIIHLTAALTVYRLAGLLFITPELKMHRLRKYTKTVALVAALLFVSHPVQTQAVTYIVQRTTSLAAFFYLLSIALYIKARIHLDRKERLHILYYAISLITALLAMFTKEIAITLPVCILVTEYFFFSPSLKQLARKFSYFWYMLLLIFVVPATSVLSRPEIITASGFAAETDTISRPIYLLTQFNVISRYLGLLFFPINQSIDYDYPIARGFFELTTFSSFLLLASLFTIGLILFRKFRLVSFGIIWFFLSLVVESSVIPIRDVIFEHRLYLPSVGIFLSVSCLLFHGLGERRKIIFALSAFIICVASLTTITRNVVWRAPILLWNDAIKKAPNKARPYLNRGVWYSNLLKSDLALKDYNHVIHIKKNAPNAYLNRGILYMEKGEYEYAITEFDKAISYQPFLAYAYANKAVAQMLMGQEYQAYKNWYKAARIEPENAFFMNGLGSACKRTKHYNLAILYFTKAIKLDDQFVESYINRGKTHHVLGNFKDAITDFNRAAELAPELSKIYYHRGLANLGLKLYQIAIKDFTLAIEKNSEYAMAYSNRGMSYFKLGDNHRALDDLNEAIRQNRNLPRLYKNRGKILQALGRLKEAESDFQKANELEKPRD